MSQLTLDRAILETLLARAVSAARLVGYIDDAAGGPAVGLLADDIDAIGHELNELLGNPHLIAASVPNARLTFASNELAPALDPVERALAFADDESTRPHVRRLRSMRGRQCQRLENAPKAIGTESVLADDWQAARHARGVNDARSATWWMRSATVTAFVVLVGLVLRLLGSCGGAW